MSEREMWERIPGEFIASEFRWLSSLDTAWLTVRGFWKLSNLEPSQPLAITADSQGSGFEECVTIGKQDGLWSIVYGEAPHLSPSTLAALVSALGHILLLPPSA